MATREMIYREQLQELGIYQAAFEPLIKELAQMDRRRTRLQKAWSDTAPPGGKPSFMDPHYQLLVQAEREILNLRESMGLTPKSLRRLTGQAAEGTAPEAGISTKLDALLARAESYDVSELNTGVDAHE